MKRHIELNVRSRYTYAGGFDQGETVLSPEEIVAFAKADGASAVALTDRFSVFGYPMFAIAAKQAGIRPIFGMELTCRKGRKERFPATMLARTQEGLANLYRILSDSHDPEDDWLQWPCADWDDVLRNREGLWIGRKCDPDYFSQIQNEDVAERIVHDFSDIDYVEILPLTEDEKEELGTIACRVVDLLQSMGKYPFAVSNAAGITQEDKLCWQMLHRGGADSDTFRPMKTTEAMLADFAFLGDLAETVVIDNTNILVDGIETVTPRPAKKDVFSIPGAEEEIRRRCRKAMVKKYGTIPPEEADKRLAEELDKIAYSQSWTRFLLAAKLCEKADEIGVLHNVSRGMEAASFVAHLLGITETDPLSPVKGGEALDCALFFGADEKKKPTFDLQFSENGIDRLLAYLDDEFGKEHICFAGHSERIGHLHASCLVNERLPKADPAYKRHLIERLMGVQTAIRGYRYENTVTLFPMDKSIFDLCPVGYGGPGHEATERRMVLMPHRYLHLEEINLCTNDTLSELQEMKELTGVPAKSVPYREVDTSKLENRGFWPGIVSYDASKETLKPYTPSNFDDLVRVCGSQAGASETVATCLRMAWYREHHPTAFYSALLNREAQLYGFGIGDILTAIRECRERVKEALDSFWEEYGKDYVFTEENGDIWAIHEAFLYEIALACFDEGIAFLSADKCTRFVPAEGGICLPSCGEFLRKGRTRFVMLEGVIDCIPSEDYRAYLREHPIELSVLQQATIVSEFGSKEQQIRLLQELSELSNDEDEKALPNTAIDEIRKFGNVGEATERVYASLFPHEGFPLFPFLEVCHLPALYQTGDLIHYRGHHCYVANGPKLTECSDFTDECYYCYCLSAAIRDKDDLGRAHEHVHICRAESSRIEDLTEQELKALETIRRLTNESGR